MEKRLLKALSIQKPIDNQQHVFLININNSVNGCYSIDFWADGTIASLKCIYIESKTLLIDMCIECRQHTFHGRIITVDNIQSFANVHIKGTYSYFPLKLSVINPLPNDGVIFLHDTVPGTDLKHKYTFNNEIVPISVSGAYDNFKQPFNEQQVALQCMKSSKYKALYKSTTELLEFWEKTRNDGTAMHLALEYYINNQPQVLTTERIDEIIIYNRLRKEVFEPLGLKEFRTELPVANTTTECPKIAGTIDLLLKSNSGEYYLCDFKRKQKNWHNKSSYKKYMYPPFKHIEDDKINNHSLQLHMYKILLEKTCNIVVHPTHLYIIAIVPSTGSYEWIKANDLSEVAQSIIENQCRA